MITGRHWRFLFPIRASLFSISSTNSFILLSKQSNSVRNELLKTWLTDIKPTQQLNTNSLRFISTTERNILGHFRSTGKNICIRSFIGMSAAGTISLWSSGVNAMDESDSLLERSNEQTGGPSGFLKELYNIWTLTKRFQLPAVLILMVVLGWRHPMTLIINILLLLACTKPSPYSVYVFVEQLRKRDMHRNPGLSKSKFFYARKVDVHDYKLLCTAKIELRDTKLSLIGVLGSWWIYRSSDI